MDLNKLSLEAIRDALVADAKKLGVTVQEHAAEKLHELEAKFGRRLLTAVSVAFLAGFVLAKVL